jgi:hypothetical protein
MEVSLLYFDGCPNHHEALAQLEALLAEAGWVGSVELINVDSPERATQTQFRGSPTVWLDGIDPFLDVDAPIGLSCRIYLTAAGYQGTPPVEELRSAIAQAVAQ